MNLINVVAVGVWGCLFACFVGVKEWRKAVFLVCSVVLWYYLCGMSYDLGVVHKYREVRGTANRISESMDIVDSLLSDGDSEEVDDLIRSAIVAIGRADERSLSKEEKNLLNKIVSCETESESKRKAARTLIKLMHANETK